MRLFIAIRLSDDMQKALVSCMHDLKKQGVEGNYVPAQNLHMTLAFIGEYDDPGKVKEVIGKVPLPGFRLALDGQGNFGNILWAGVKGNQKLKAYVREVREALIRKISAKKPYQIHLPKAEMTVKRASLMKSETKNGKVVYREL